MTTMTVALPEKLKRELQLAAKSEERIFSDWLRLELAKIVKAHARVSGALDASDSLVAENRQARPKTDTQGKS